MWAAPMGHSAGDTEVLRSSLGPCEQHPCQPSLQDPGHNGDRRNAWPGLPSKGPPLQEDVDSFSVFTLRTATLAGSGGGGDTTISVKKACGF